ncbi:MAG: hypothetical protein Q4E36_02450 [Bacillota bacterium]|nr:hypothetical protein [Bacillota bacterium]
MIDRSYLPFKSARKYVDRGMAKWMGFFISEHTAALAEEDQSIDFSRQMNKESLALLLGQAYIKKLRLILYTNLRKNPFIGRVEEISANKIYFSSEGRVLILDFKSLIALDLVEGDGHD